MKAQYSTFPILLHLPALGGAIGRCWFIHGETLLQFHPEFLCITIRAGSLKVPSVAWSVSLALTGILQVQFSRLHSLCHLSAVPQGADEYKSPTTFSSVFLWFSTFLSLSQTYAHLPVVSPPAILPPASCSTFLYRRGRCTVKWQGLRRVDISQKPLYLSWQLCRADPRRSFVAVTQSQMLKSPRFSWYCIQLFITWHLQQPT